MRPQSACAAVYSSGSGLPEPFNGRVGSLTFEPDDNEAPLLRVSLRDVPRPLGEWQASVNSSASMAWSFEQRQSPSASERFAPLKTIRLAPSTSQPSPPPPPLRIALAQTRPSELAKLLNNLLDISTRPHTQQGAPLQQLYENSS